MCFTKQQNKMEMFNQTIESVTKPLMLNPLCQVIRGYFTSNGKYTIDMIIKDIMINIHALESQIAQYDQSALTVPIIDNHLYSYVFINVSTDAGKQCNFFILPKTVTANGYVRSLKNSIHKIFATNRGFGIESTMLYPSFRFSAVVLNKPQYPQPELLIHFIQMNKTNTSVLDSDCVLISNYFNFLQIQTVVSA